jgi:hypothetical protein
MTDNQSGDGRAVRTLPSRNAAVAIEQSRAEAALRESETRFRELADNKGWIYWYNKRWHDYTGTTLKEMEG